MTMEDAIKRAKNIAERYLCEVYVILFKNGYYDWSYTYKWYDKVVAAVTISGVVYM